MSVGIVRFDCQFFAKRQSDVTHAVLRKEVIAFVGADEFISVMFLRT